MQRPEHTTRPLYWLAQERGKDYTDVLNVAWGIKQQIREDEPGPAYNDSLARIIKSDADEDHSNGYTTFQAIHQHVSDFVAKQDTQSRIARREAQERAMSPNSRPFPFQR